MIERDEVVRWARAWRVAEAQVVKDHLVSHLLSALDGIRGMVFFGGTALHRTFVADRRVSEDIDLFLSPRDPAEPDTIIDALAAGTRREFPNLRIERQRVAGDVRAFLATESTTIVLIQIIGPRPDYSRLEVTRNPVRLRYTDLPDTVDLAVPTVSSLAAMKLSAWEDRHAPRDLFDLGELAAIDSLDAAAASALQHWRGVCPVRTEYEPTQCPTPDTWVTELGHQTADLGDPADILDRVRRTLFPTR